MVKVHVSKVEWSPTFGSNVVALRELGGDRYCNIILREWEAQTISVLLNQKSQEPYKTAWLLSYVLENLDIKILRVEIRKTFRAEVLAKMIYCNSNNIDSITHTPGEAIELAMRCKASRLVPGSFLNVYQPTAKQSNEQNTEVERLQAMLEKAIEMEEFEKAAKFRDKILKLEKKAKSNSDEL